MNHPCYQPNVSSDYTTYEFDSVGKNGICTHLIKYSPIPELDGFYNLGFGKKLDDHNIDDQYINDNGDRDLILATVVKSVYAFSEQYANQYIIFRGSTESRTRLYRMLLNIYFNSLSKDFYIWGIVNNTRIPFEPDSAHHYDLFIVLRKYWLF